MTCFDDCLLLPADIDECVGAHNCHSNSTCINSDGSFSCRCFIGFSGNGRRCSNIDECSSTTPPCDTQASCRDTIGSFVCRCSVGYAGSGIECSDVDECASESHTCHFAAQCGNTPGSYGCTCRPGFAGNGRECENIDECHTKLHTCDKNAACQDTLGNFSCVCRYGYTGSGYHCEVHGKIGKHKLWFSKHSSHGHMDLFVSSCFTQLQSSDINRHDTKLCWYFNI